MKNYCKNGQEQSSSETTDHCCHSHLTRIFHSRVNISTCSTPQLSKEKDWLGLSTVTQM